ncbi:MAG: proI [Bacilli bacterium]|nr:proI [Bacilli bacterium]
MSKSSRILLAGAGNIAEALIRGWHTTKAVPPENITAINRSNQQQIRLLQENYGIQGFTGVDARQLVTENEVLVIAVKPKDVTQFLHSVRDSLTPEHIIVSVAAGISTTQMEQAAGLPVSVVRAMPNTGMAVLESATAVSYGQYCTDRARQLSQVLLGAVGTLSVVEERMMDAVTGLSGSGPAYLYYLAEAMQAAGTLLGLPEETAQQLVIQTMVGAAKMLQKGDYTAPELRDKVTSPNGTTYAGLQVLREGQFAELMIAAIDKAAKRAAELGLSSK